MKKEMLEIINMIEALDLPYKEGQKVFEKAGFDERNRFEVSASKFIDMKIKTFKRNFAVEIKEII